jgi:ubiquitin C-terminal hydrolase
LILAFDPSVPDITSFQNILIQGTFYELTALINRPGFHYTTHVSIEGEWFFYDDLEPVRVPTTMKQILEDGEPRTVLFYNQIL